MKKSISSNKTCKPLRKQQVDSLLKKAGNFSSSQFFKTSDNQQVSDRWITVGDNSSFNNELKVITSWQTGQAY